MSETVGSEPVSTDNVPHRLFRKWTLWYDNQEKTKPGEAWGSSIKKAYTFDTIKEFWGLYDHVFKPSKFPGNAEFHLFKDGIEPKWEDPECANGGKWTVTSSSKSRLDQMWLETMMALIGEQIDGADDICGVVASVRQGKDKLSLWTKTAANEAAQLMTLSDADCYSQSGYFLDALSVELVRRFTGVGKLMATYGWLGLWVLESPLNFGGSHFVADETLLIRNYYFIEMETFQALLFLHLMGIGRKWKEIIDTTDKLTYIPHGDKRERSAKIRYNV